MEKTLGEQLRERLEVASHKILENVVREILKRAKDNADSPERWPLEINCRNTNSIVHSHRLLNDLSDSVEQYGLMVYVGPESTLFADILGMEAEEECYQEADERPIPKAEQAYLDSVGMRNARLEAVIEYVGNKIRQSIDGGHTKAVIDVKPEPIGGEKAMIKRLLKSLAHLGYYVFSDGVKIDVSSRPAYDKIEKLEVSWIHHK